MIVAIVLITGIWALHHCALVAAGHLKSSLPAALVRLALAIVFLIVVLVTNGLR
jgi:hypothetical protein